jgi:hypothetical protein
MMKTNYFVIISAVIIFGLSACDKGAPDAVEPSLPVVGTPSPDLDAESDDIEMSDAAFDAMTDEAAEETEGALGDTTDPENSAMQQ